MKKILFVCAMKKEAVDISEKLELKKINEKIYKKDSVTMLITGIGKQKTAISLIEYLLTNEKPDLVINVGYAGSTDLKVGSWVSIKKSYNYEWDIPGEEKYSMLDYGNQELVTIDKIENVDCYSSESFVSETNLNGHIAFDMELHSVTLICDMYKIPLMSLKKISDNLSLDKYYENIEQNNLMELSSSIELLKSIPIGDGSFWGICP